jgi:hypothetical protein
VENQVEIGRLSTRMKELLYREEMMCLQRSRITWLKEGDQNTKFFHRKVIGRGKKNKIENIFFQDLYTADPSVALEDLIQLFWPIIT